MAGLNWNPRRPVGRKKPMAIKLVGKSLNKPVLLNGGVYHQNSDTLQLKMAPHFFKSAKGLSILGLEPVCTTDDKVARVFETRTPMFDA